RLHRRHHHLVGLMSLEPSLLGAVPAGIREAGLTVHGAFANLVWTYLIGHASLAVLHELAGHRLFRQMFSLRS
ncbi:hypothetical protein, partial [Caulobacter sp. CCH5-E12]|uniref:hypothetical protein n=1 Tax=Caulobacter sp. CCH5-E12 TaxID=1768770 RepID=UPI001E28A845